MDKLEEIDLYRDIVHNYDHIPYEEFLKLINWELSNTKILVENEAFKRGDKDGIVSKILMSSYGIEKDEKGNYKIK